MKVTTEELENRQMAMTIEVENNEAEKALRKAARTLSRKYDIPGFRPGKAPYNVVVRLLGLAAVQEQALDDLAEKLYKQALKEEDIQPYDTASLDQVTWNPLTLRLTIPLPPQVDLGAYREVRLTPEEVTVTEEQVAEVLERIRKDNATWQPVERAAQFGDMVTIDIEATADDEVILSTEGREMILLENSRYPLPGFTHHLIGMEAGEEKTFTMTYPEDYYREDLAGREAQFTVLMQSVKGELLPDLDDALAMATGFESLDELKQAIRDQLLDEAQREANERFLDQALDQMVERANISYPPVMLEDEIDEMIEEQESFLQRRGMTLENFLTLRNQTEEELREELRPHAERRLRTSLLLSELVKAEKLTVNDGEVKEEIERIARSMDENADAIRDVLSSPQNKITLYNRLLLRKALDRVTAIAKGEAPELEAQEQQ